MDVVYELAVEFHVPVLLHFEEGASNSGFARFERVASKFPNLNFICHAQTWWANISRSYKMERDGLCPAGRVMPGGLTDRLLAGCANVYGDLSGRSGWNALTRDEDRTRAFLNRHRDKLFFGSDCMHGGMDGPECWVRQTQKALRRLVPSAEILRKILCGNGRRLLRA
jgi:predicted TIM-barrel fold metal-dependent hydrolase